MKRTKNRTIARFMTVAMLLLAALSCAACTNDVVGFMNVSAEMSALSQIEQTGTIKLSLNLSDEAKENWPADSTDMTLTYTAQTDNAKMQSKLVGELAVGSTKFPLTVYMDNVKLYFNASELIALYQLVESENSEGLYQLTSALGGNEWLCVDLMDADAWEEYCSALLKADVSTESIYGEAVDLMKALTKPYSGLDSKLLTQKGNTYTVTFDNDSAINFINEFLLYSIENSENIGSALITWVDGCDLLDDAYKAEIKSTIYAGMAYAQGLTDENKADLTADLLTGVETWPFDCSVKYTLTRNSAKSFGVGLNIDYNETDTASISGISGLKLTATATTVAKNNLKIDVPTTGIVNSDDLSSNGIAPSGVSATIYLDEDYMSYHHYYALSLLDESGTNTPDVRIINSTTYLGLRPVAEACGEEVGWDSTKKCAYVVRGGEPVYVTGYVDTTIGRSYLKIRDFEKLGYTVNYEKNDYIGQFVTLVR